MLNWNKICGFVAIFSFSALISTAQKVSYVLPVPLSRPSLYNTIQASFTKENQGLKEARPVNMINQDYYIQQLGFMCKKELALEKITKIPLRIRLGSLQQCNYLEGKK